MSETDSPIPRPNRPFTAWLILLVAWAIGLAVWVIYMVAFVYALLFILG